jgi:hypothetical protein
MKRLAQSIAIALALMTAAAAQADYSGSAMTAELKKDLKRRVEDTPAWRTEVGGNAGELVRPFTASSVRPMATPSGGQVHIGFRVSGRFSTGSGRTYIDSMAQPRRMPARIRARGR